MGSIKKILFVLFIIATLIYIFVRAVVIVGDGVIAFATDKDGQIISQLQKGFNIIPDGIISPVRIYYIPVNNSCSIDVIVPIPPLELLQSDSYAIKIPFAINYSLLPQKLSLNIQKIYSDDNYILQYLRLKLQNLIKENVAKYLHPNYQYYQLMANIKNEISLAIAHCKESCAQEGIQIHDITAGVVFIPDYTIYIEGKKYLSELLQQEKDNVLRLKALEQKLKEDEMKNASRLQYLENMSKLITKNKEILKYIYIDKLADNVKVIVTSEKNAPFDIVTDEASDSSKKDFDNFKK